MFAVTGCPRSATKYMAHLLREVNISCTHEAEFRPRTALQDLFVFAEIDRVCGDSSWLAWVFLDLVPTEMVVLHQLRDPWKVIDSLAFRNHILRPDAPKDRGAEALRQCIRWYCPQAFEPEDVVTRAAVFWVLWNQLIEKACEENPYVTYRRYWIEDVNPATLSEICNTIGAHRDRIECWKALQRIPKNINTNEHWDYNMRLAPELLEMIEDKRGKPLPGGGELMAVIKQDTPRTPEVLRSMIAPEHVAKVDELAARYGYKPTAPKEKEEVMT